MDETGFQNMANSRNEEVVNVTANTSSFTKEDSNDKISISQVAAGNALG